MQSMLDQMSDGPAPRVSLMLSLNPTKYRGSFAWAIKVKFPIYLIAF
jgi:hypothetical protein